MDEPVAANSDRNSAGIVHFGIFDVNLRAGELRKGGVKIKLYGQPFNILAALLERPGQVVTREELKQRLWNNDTFVDFEHGLNKAVNKVREALGDDADNPRFVETLPRRGYRFIASVNGISAGATEAPATEPPSDGNGKPSVAISSPRARWRHARWVFSAGVAVAVLGVGAYFHFRRAPALTERDPIILADFTNTTGDPVFDGALHQGLSVQFEQTPFLRMVSPDEIAQALRLMEKPPDTPLTQGITREVCQRSGAIVEVDGSIAALDNQYVIGLRAVNCKTGDVVAEEQTTAIGKEKVIAALGNAAFNLRSKLGESHTSLERYNVPLEQMTTSSLEALHEFSSGAAEFSSFNFPSAASHFEHAVNLDRNFAGAYSILGTTHAFLGQSSLAAEDMKEAYALRERVSEYEQLYISMNYLMWATGDLERALQDSQVWTQAYPRDFRTWATLSYIYRLLGRNDEALATGLECVRLNPASAPAYTTPIMVYTRQGRLDQAVATIHEGEARHLYVSPRFMYTIDFLRHDEAGMTQQAKPLGADYFSLEAETAAYRGQLARSRDLTERAIASDRQAHADEGVAVVQARSALTEALFGNLAQARGAAMRVIEPSASWDAQANAALALALAGDEAQARKVIADLNRRFPESTFVQFYYLPAIGAALSLRQGKPEEAIEGLGAVTSYDLALNEASSVRPALIPAYIRGEAYLSARRGAQAAAEFQRILDHPGFVGNFPVGALAHLGLARAYAVQSDTIKAKAAYEDFLTLWKDADPDIPILKQAKAEYAKLQ